MERKIAPGDEETYHFSALNLLHHHAFTRDVTGDMFNGTAKIIPTANLSPGFPIYIAAIYELFGEDPRNVLVSNVTLSIFSFWLIYKLLRLLNVSRIGLVVALSVAAVYPGFLYNNDRLLTEQLFMALFLGTVYLFLAGAQGRKAWILAAAGVILAASTHVRAQAVLFLILGSIYLAVYTRQKGELAKLGGAFVGGFVLCMAPWWIRNFAVFGSFIPLTQASTGPQIWGAVPYFLDMADTNGKKLADVVSGNYSASPSAYIRWRLFGYMNNMWGDVWDENLTHPGKFLQRAAFICQLLFLVPAMIATPWLVRKRIPQWTLIAAIPLIIVLPNVIFHGLPRYAVLAAPYVIIAGGLLLTRASSPSVVELDLGKGAIHRVGHALLFYLTISYAAWIFYSVYVFPSRVPTDMSEYRLGKYAHTTIENLSNADVVADDTYKPSQMEVWNSKPTDENGSFQNSADPGIFIVRPGERKDAAITRVSVSIRGGAPSDYTTIHWMTAESPNLSDSHHYRTPRLWFKERLVFYIDGDAKELLLVPSVLQGNSFTLESVRVTKYKQPVAVGKD
ncbi:ArnT family glycosyltransferase [Achromobacter ruhlandii]|uniref:ArnT family glycosyltransferase n=1 Tax=Achromobacter ruhlandii TaxID=72557 RepID=UPI0009EE6C71|nr:glycosyltransferase family 39 protein [Achromobacter ruhlandii]